MSRGDEIVSAVREWLGTPYRHQASCKGAGCDCLGLLRGLWREVLGAEPEAIPAYSMDWSEPAGDGLRLIAGCDKRGETCRLKFNNYLNFQGFPDIPGDDWTISDPSRAGRLDGGSRRG